jgi:hypothetical protein
MNSRTVIEAVEVLNRALASDPEAVAALVNHRVRCNLTLAQDETVQVGHIDDDPASGLEVGMMGILNGIFGVRPNRCGYIAAICDLDTGLVVRFMATDDDGKELK